MPNEKALYRRRYRVRTVHVAMRGVPVRQRDDLRGGVLTEGVDQCPVALIRFLSDRRLFFDPGDPPPPAGEYGDRAAQRSTASSLSRPIGAASSIRGITR
jgi:hypothetical protein